MVWREGVFPSCSVMYHMFPTLSLENSDLVPTFRVVLMGDFVFGLPFFRLSSAPTFIKLSSQDECYVFESTQKT